MSTAVDKTIARLNVARATGRLPMDLADDVVAILREGPGDTMRQKEAALYLGVSARALRNWKRRGIGPPFQTAGRVLIYSRTAVRAWIEKSGSVRHDAED